ncbi:hypothetical protein P2G88_00355 [Aliiglaciecola sp. CAU 1673]|uniref:hypothetical protein n=1 Tax=Aliiglaciecola sp. CAU 1673 TaxID=3032595 RepID=UPI0023DC0D5B|nr:hypothetical protein [Aliiglaciecola sp. CAU 1673]MDF2176698.1 hypothetical protein [Aliiglaciecola sp. CAU 1673]
MNKRKPISRPLLFLLSLALLPFYLHAQDKSPEMLAEVWVMTPKADMQDAFEKGLKEHMAQRVKLGDPRKWNVYRPVLGDGLNSYVIRACCFQWKDLDSYRNWSIEKDPMKHWNKNVDPKVHKYEHYLSVVDTQNSHWPEDTKYNYVGVSWYQVKMGHWQEMEADKKLMSDLAKQHNWPYNWAWASSVSNGGSMSLAVPYADYASMAPPAESFAAFMGKHMGAEEKAKEMLKRWASHFEERHYNIYRHDKELSME